MSDEMHEEVSGDEVTGEAEATVDERHDPSRREMLSAAVKFSGIMAGLGLAGQTLLGSSEAHAKLPKEQRIKRKDLPPVVNPKQLEGPGRPNIEVDGEALRALLDEAIKGGSMASAIKKWGPETRLPKDVLAELGNISDADLKALKVVRQQLGASLNGIGIESMWGVHEHATFRKKK